MFSLSDTIAAIATPPGRGGLGVIRISGADAPAIASRLIDRGHPLRPREATFGRVRELGAAHRVVDQVVVTWFPGPHSYTTEDVVEIGAHGSPLLLTQILDLTVDAGARLAEPGEFTFRAYVNGRVDLVQAEAVRDLIEAVTPLQARAAMDQLEGTLTSAIATIDAALLDLTAKLEASLDFPEEGFHFVTRDAAADAIAEIASSLEALIRAGDAGRLIREGSLVVVAGRPNVGKSSLFNALLGTSRAIVADAAGTTRDLLTECVDIGGLAFTLVDTAGLRESTDVVEMEGVRRARDAARAAALSLLVLDCSEPLTPDDERLIDQAPAATLHVIAKTDLRASWSAADYPRLHDAVGVSSIHRTGLDALKRRIVETLTGRDVWRDPPAVSNVRHLTLLRHAREDVRRAEEAVAAGATEELVVADLVRARQTLEYVTGPRDADDLLRHIFSQFCVGK